MHEHRFVGSVTLRRFAYRYDKGTGATVSTHTPTAQEGRGRMAVAAHPPSEESESFPRNALTGRELQLGGVA